MYRQIYEEVSKKWDKVAKPIDGLGKFEKIICKIGAIKGSSDFSLDRKAAVIFCGDNGIVKEGVAQTDSSVTALVCSNIHKGTATSSVMARCAGADCIAVDVGVRDHTKADIVFRQPSETKSFLYDRAMTLQQAKDCVRAGEQVVKKLAESYDILAIGEMGIGNTTTAAACAAAVLDRRASDVTGRGSGLSDEKYIKKIRIIDEALLRHKPDKNIYDILSCTGGYEIGAMAGAFIGAKKYGIPVIADGAVSLSALLLAQLEHCDIADYVIGSHRGREPLCALALERLGLEAVIDGNMALGEGTGAIMLFPLLDMAMAVYNNKTFEELGMESYKR